jgi:REP element-mobilizing transposase RayT
MARTRQVELRFRTWGGARRGAGRPPKGKRALVSHLARPEFAERFPLHVTLRMREDVWNLRTQRCLAPLRQAFADGGERFGFRLVHYSVQGNHIHLLVEAAGKESLSLGMQGLGVRIARALNRVMKRRGSVFADHYHARILRTPAEVARVRTYLLRNAERHYGLRGADPFASADAVPRPRTWLLRRHC